MDEQGRARGSNFPSANSAAEQLSFEILLPCVEHALQVVEWRNDALTRQWSYSQRPKEWPAFFDRFVTEYFAFIPPLFVLCRGQRVGFLRFRPVADPFIPSRRCCDISIIVSPSHRGRGIATASLKAVQPWLATQGFQALYAEAFKDNSASCKAFTRAGFTALPEERRWLEESQKEIAIRPFLALLTENGARKLKSTYIIAEAGSNWRVGTPSRDKAMAHALIEAAAAAGADAVKFQFFRAATMYAPHAGRSGYLTSTGIESQMDELFRELEIPYEMVPELSTACQKANIELLITPFSPDDFVAVDRYVSKLKIASYELNHIHLLTLAARSKKPLFLSTGASTGDEIAWAVDTYRSLGGKELTLMHCTACYPAPPVAMNLRAIPWMRQRFGTDVGLSDHSRHPTAAPVAAVALGASVIEKHFTIDNTLPGPDHLFAITPAELAQLVAAVREAEEMPGAYVKVVAPEEEELRAFARRGIQSTRSIRAGEILHEGDNIAILRPGQRRLGVHSKFINEIEGATALREIDAGEGIQHGDYSKSLSRQS